MRTMRAWNYGLAAVLAACIASHAASGAISFEPVTWGSGGATLGWQRGSGDALSLNSPVTGGNPDGYLSLNFDSGNMLQFDEMFNTQYTGDYTAHSGLSVSFDFRGFTGSPQSLYFESDAGVTRWYYDLDIASEGWLTHRVEFGSESGWVHASGETDFFAALASVSAIGFLLGHQDASLPFSFGLDNWKFGNEVPEPGAVALALAVLGASMAVLRRNRSRAPVPDGVTG